jgi:hypothetical protein
VTPRGRAERLAVILRVSEESPKQKILHFVQDDGRMRIRVRLDLAVGLQQASPASLHERGVFSATRRSALAPPID